MPNFQLIHCPEAPSALGNYSHAVCYQGLIFVSGMAGRNPQTNEIPGLKLDGQGKKIGYDIRAETRATLENISRVLQSAGSGLNRVLEVNVYLLDMNDFAAYNEIYATFFASHKPSRTTIGVAGLPGQIAIEMKVVAAGGPDEV